MTGTVVVDTGTVSAAAAHIPTDTRRPPDIARFPALVPDRLVVKLRSSANISVVEPLVRTAGGRIVSTIPRLDVIVVQLEAGVRAGSALAMLRASPHVQHAEQDGYAYVLATPNDPYYGSQWHYPMIQLPAAWDVTTGSPVIVAVVDTGIRPDHPEFVAGVLVAGRNFFNGADDTNTTDPGCPNTEPTRYSHGTHVAGTVAALTNNGVGVAGVAWGGASGVKIMPVRVLGELPGLCGVGYTSDVAKGVVWATDNGARVINLSLGGTADVQVMREAVQYALDRGVAVVAAAGNSNTSAPHYPAAYLGVIAVSALACDGQKAYYSNFGPYVFVAAPGGDATKDCPGGLSPDLVLSTGWRPSEPSNFTYVGLQGTSMAAPHVSGVAALLVGRGFVGPAAIRERLRLTATDLGAPGWDETYGYGLVNAAAAVGGQLPATRLRAFVGVLAGSQIQRQSSFVLVSGTGAFTVPDAQSGTKSVFAWQDHNDNGRVDVDDYYGKVDGVNVPPGGTVSAGVVTVRRYTGTTLTVTPP
ncbi:MAG: S8 family peptidase [Armatimonadota bacterium]|nr:S8 family peptidase [Armatimonadota bacterium]